MMFQQKTAVITGAASGMGLLTCQKLAEEGANVVMLDVNKEAVEKASKEINEKNFGKTIPLVCDIRKYDEVKDAVQLAYKTFGSLDITASFAGGSSARVLKEFLPFNEMSIEVMDWGIDVNLKGPMYLARAALEIMLPQKSGVIVNIGSVTGLEGGSNADYSAAKSGLIGFTKSVALIGAPHNVRCVCVTPGPILTRPEMSCMKTPMRRAGEPIELVDMVLFLCSDKASFITGSNHVVDGGRTLGGFGG